MIKHFKQIFLVFIVKSKNKIKNKKLLCFEKICLLTLMPWGPDCIVRKTLLKGVTGNVWYV